MSYILLLVLAKGLLEILIDLDRNSASIHRSIHFLLQVQVGKLTKRHVVSCVCLSQRHVSKQANFHHLQRSDFFGHCSQYVATGEGRNIGQPLNLQLGFHSQPPYQTSTASVLLQELFQSTCQSPPTFFFNS